MTIDEAYRFVNFVSNKEQRGNITPSQFNNLAKSAQQEFISKRLGNIKMLSQDGVPSFGYESTWKVHEDIRPLVYGPIQIPVDGNGNFPYPYGYIWPDSVHKNDFSQIKRLTPDQYPWVKKNTIYPPTDEYPVLVFRGPGGVIDPASIGSFQMSYVKNPVDPNWDYIMENDAAVFAGDVNTKKYLVKNSVFLSGLDFWIQNGSGLPWSYANGHAAFIANSAGASSSVDLLQLIYPVIGTSIKIDVDYASANFITPTLQITLADSSKNDIVSVDVLSITQATGSLSIDVNVPSGTAYVLLRFDGVSTGGGYFYLNKVNITGFTSNTSYNGETGQPSQEFMVNPYTSAHTEICMIILQNVGINLDAGQLAQYAALKENSIS